MTRFGRVPGVIHVTYFRFLQTAAPLVPAERPAIGPVWFLPRPLL